MSDNNVMLLEPRRQRENLYAHRETSTWPASILKMLAAMSAGVLALFIHYWLPLNANVAATRIVQSLQAPGLKELTRLISGFGNAPKVIVITSIVLFVFSRRTEAFFLAFSGLGGWITAMVLKHFFSSPRPTADLVNVFHQWPNGSFPSGHLVFYVCYFGFLFVIARDELPVKTLYRRLVLIFLLMMIGLVGFSRVYLGEHWVSDLLGSYVLGTLWLWMSVKLYQIWVVTRERQRRLTLGVATWN